MLANSQSRERAKACTFHRTFLAMQLGQRYRRGMQLETCSTWEQSSSVGERFRIARMRLRMLTKMVCGG